MKIWVDAQLSSQLALWMGPRFDVEAKAVRELGLREAEDEAIFLAARREGAVVMTKDADFAALLERLGPPPQILWITCGNTSNAVLRGVLERSFPEARRLLETGEALVEIAQ